MRRASLMSRPRALPSHPDNARLQLQMSTEWYAKNAQKATALFQDMMTE